MSSLKKYSFSQLYQMSSGISSTKEQAGHGGPFLSFSAVFNNYFVPYQLVDLMDASAQQQKTCSIKGGDIFLTRTSETVDELAMSAVAIKDYPQATYSGFLKRLRPIQRDVTYPKFMAFYLRSPMFRRTMTNNAVMTLRASLNEAIFSYLDLLLPEYDEQVKIGDLLFLLNEKISLNNRINTELEMMAKTLYDYWFMQFDFPDANGKPYKTSGGKMVYDKTLKREIPYGWEARSLSSLTSLGKETITPSMWPEKKFNYYSIPVFDTTKTFSSERGASVGSNKFTVCERDILVSKLNPWFPRVIYVRDEKDLICSTELVVWRTKNDAIKNILYMVATSKEFITYCTQSATGTSNSHKRVPPALMMDFSIPHNDYVFNVFGDNLTPIINKITSNQRENTKLKQLRDWLLPMLINGQVKVK